jgi:hypothetical protein
VRFSDSFLHSSGVRSFAAFLTLGCFFSPLPAAGAAAALAAGSIACASAAATQFLGRVLEGEVCLSRKGPPSNWADAGGRARCPDRRKLAPNLDQGWVKPNTSLRQSGCVAPLKRAQPPLASGRTDSNGQCPNQQANAPTTLSVLPTIFF